MTASPSKGEQVRFLENTIKPGGVAGVPESYYRKALDLNRFSNSVANKLLESYRRQIVKAVRELERIDKEVRKLDREADEGTAAPAMRWFASFIWSLPK